MEIEIDRDVLLRLLQQTAHSSVILQHDYRQAGADWREMIEVSGLNMGRVKLSIARAKLSPTPSPAAPQSAP